VVKVQVTERAKNVPAPELPPFLNQPGFREFFGDQFGRRGTMRQPPQEGLGSGGFSPPANVSQAPGGPKGQLYDLAKDPAELNNLYQKRPEIVDSLSTLLQKYKDQGHTRPLTGR